MKCPRCGRDAERLVEYADAHDVELVCDNCSNEMKYEDWKISVDKSW